MRRRLLLIWLIVSVLGYGIALAADLHGLGGAHAGATLQLDNAHGDDPDGGSATDYDHCCHGAAHLLGLGHSLGATPTLQGPPPRIEARVALACPPPSSPYRPPITI